MSWASQRVTDDRYNLPVYIPAGLYRFAIDAASAAALLTKRRLIWQN